MALAESSTDTRSARKMNQQVLAHIKPETSMKEEMTKLRLSLFGSGS